MLLQGHTSCMSALRSMESILQIRLSRSADPVFSSDHDQLSFAWFKWVPGCLSHVDDVMEPLSVLWKVGDLLIRISEYDYQTLCSTVNVNQSFTT